MVRRLLDAPTRARLVSNIIGHLKDGVSDPVLARAFDYWSEVDKDLGDRIAGGMQEKMRVVPDEQLRRIALRGSPLQIPS